MPEPTKKQEWQKCPNCKCFIPKHWKVHTKCGWKGEITETKEIKETQETKTKVLIDKRPLKEIKTCPYCEHYHGVTCE